MHWHLSRLIFPEGIDVKNLNINFSRTDSLLPEQCSVAHADVPGTLRESNFVAKAVLPFLEHCQEQVQQVFGVRPHLCKLILVESCIRSVTLTASADAAPPALPCPQAAHCPLEHSALAAPCQCSRHILWELLIAKRTCTS